MSRSGSRLRIRWTRFYWVKLDRLLHVPVLGCCYTFLCFLSTFVSAMCYHKRKYLWENPGVTEGFGHSRDVGRSREQEWVRLWGSEIRLLGSEYLDRV